MSSIWIVSMVLQWVLIFALCLLVFSLMRQLGEITLRLNAGASAPEPPNEDAFKPYADLPEIEVSLLGGGKFRAGGKRQPLPCLIVNYSPSCTACAEMPEAIREFARRVPQEKFQLLAVLRIERTAAQKYVDDRALGSVAIALEEDFPEQLKTGLSPFALAVAVGGVIAASGKPKKLSHLLEMAQAARSMAESAPSHSRRQHEWGESAPYWNFEDEAKPDARPETPQLAGASPE